MATAIELYGFAGDRKSKDEAPSVNNTNLISSGSATIPQQFESAKGPITNVAGGVKGDVFSGEFGGPVAVDGEAVDFRGSTGATYKPTIQKREKLPSPRLYPPPQDFTGREEELGRLLSHFNRGATITGLRGTGGIGKTALALVLADKLKSHFQDGQIFLNLEGTSPNPLKPADAMAQVIRAFRGSEERLPDGQNELQRLFNSVLEGKSVLLLLDNAADDKQVLPLLPPSGCAVLVTSRKKFTLPGMAEPFQLDTLKPSEAQDLLLKICPRIGSQAEKLAKLCGFFPLALRATASLLAVNSDLSPSSYLEELRFECTRLENIGNEGVDLNMEASLDLSYGRLPTDTAIIFCLLSVFPSDFDAAAEEVVCQDKGHEHLSELVRWSLVDYQLTGKEDEGRYNLHDLVRIFAASHLKTKEKEEVQQRHADHYENVLSISDQFYQQGGVNILAGLGLLDLEWANIQAGQAWAEKNLEANPFAAVLSSSYPNAGTYVLDLRQHPLERIRWREKALAAARQLGDRSAEGAHLGNLGCACHSLGDAHHAIDYYEQHLALAREIGDRKGEGNSLNNLGSAYFSLGDVRRSIDYFEQRLNIAREIGNKKSEGTAMNNLGIAYLSLGDTRRAISYCEQALAIAREIGDRKGEGVALGNLGNVYADMGDAHHAIDYYAQDLAITREIGDRMGESSALGNLGLACRDLGDVHHAIDYYAQDLAITREIGNRKGEGSALANLGLAYAQLGDTRSGINCCEQALTIARKIGDRRCEGASMFNMSLMLYCNGKQADAVRMARDALQIIEQIESPDAERVRRCLAEWKG